MSEAATTPTTAEETFDSITILEQNENAERFGHEPGKRVIMNGSCRALTKFCEQSGQFVDYAETVATIDLFQPLTDDEITDWLNSDVGKHVLAHYFDREWTSVGESK